MSDEAKNRGTSDDQVGAQATVVLKDVLAIVERERLYWESYCEGGSRHDPERTKQDASDGWAACENIAGALQLAGAFSGQRTNSATEVDGDAADPEGDAMGSMLCSFSSFGHSGANAGKGCDGCDDASLSDFAKHFGPVGTVYTQGAPELRTTSATAAVALCTVRRLERDGTTSACFREPGHPGKHRTAGGAEWFATWDRASDAPPEKTWDQAVADGSVAKSLAEDGRIARFRQWAGLELNDWFDNAEARQIVAYVDASRTDYAPARGQVFRHYKGSLYELLSFARLSEDRNTEVVVYRSFETGQVWVRPLATAGQDSWRDEVVWPDGVRRERFEPTQKRGDGT